MWMWLQGKVFLVVLGRMIYRHTRPVLDPVCSCHEDQGEMFKYMCTQEGQLSRDRRTYQLRLSCVFPPTE